MEYHAVFLTYIYIYFHVIANKNNASCGNAVGCGGGGKVIKASPQTPLTCSRAAFNSEPDNRLRS